MTRFLANENFPLASVVALRSDGLDVVSVIERCPGEPDHAVLALAARESRIVVTFDRDYGELVFRRRLPAPAGVLYLRFLPRDPMEPAKYLLRLMKVGVVLEGHFTVGERDAVRQRPLPRFP